MKWLLAIGLFGIPLTTFGVTYEERAVASVLMGEAWSEGTRGMVAVAEVIRQRTVEKKESPLQVISARHGRVHAFSCLNGTSVDSLIHKFDTEPAYQNALQVARVLCENPSNLPGMTMAANHYTRISEHPYWARGHRPVAIIGTHAFYKISQY